MPLALILMYNLSLYLSKQSVILEMKLKETIFMPIVVR